MAINTFNEYKTKLLYPLQRAPISKSGPSIILPAAYMSSFTANADPGSTPSTAAAVDASITGAVPLYSSSSTLRLGGLHITNTANAIGSLVLICDRLSHQGGLSGTTTGAQTTNLPTAALTRYTSGVGVMAGIEIYTQIGATSTTVSVSYTDQDGNAGITSPLVAIGNTGYREIRRIIILPLAQGDTGVKSVESVTLTATTGTAGNFGITLFKPLYAVPTFGIYDRTVNTDLLFIDAALPEIIDTACIFFLITGSGTGASFDSMLSLIGD